MSGKIKMHGLLAAAFMLSLFAVSADAATKNPKSENLNTLPNVLIIGDSISIGYTPHVRRMLAGKANVTRAKTAKGGIINCGSTAIGLEGLDGWLGETKWDVIHFNWGLWDLCYRHPDAKAYGNRDKINGTVTATPKQYQANLRKLVKKLKATGAVLVWATTTPVPEGEAGRIAGDAVKYNAEARKVMEENEIVINDLYAHIKPVAGDYYIKPGDVHYTQTGSEFLGKKVAAAIETALSPKTMLLWPDGTPGALGNEAKDKPTLTAYLPVRQTATGAGVVICPGGGYRNVAKDHEGIQVARWLNSFGVAAFVLDYRNMGKGYPYPAPQMDVRRALRIVRSRVSDWHIKTDKIGVLGFSAGGHLAGTAGTLFNTDIGNSEDDLSDISCRPDFMVLCYPVVSMTKAFTHGGSKNNLLGTEPKAELVKQMSVELQVTKKTPPTFLMHANDDRGVLPENSIAVYTALRKAGVAAELHIYEKGGHGFGLGQGKGTAAHWPDACRNWILQMTK